MKLKIELCWTLLYVINATFSYAIHSVLRPEYTPIYFKCIPVSNWNLILHIDSTSSIGVFWEVSAVTFDLNLI